MPKWFRDLEAWAVGRPITSTLVIGSVFLVLGAFVSGYSAYNFGYDKGFGRAISQNNAEWQAKFDDEVSKKVAIQVPQQFKAELDASNAQITVLTQENTKLKSNIVDLNNRLSKIIQDDSTKSAMFTAHHNFVESAKNIKSNLDAARRSGNQGDLLHERDSFKIFWS